MRSARLDRRFTGTAALKMAALATACSVLLVPTQEKPLRWLAGQALHFKPAAKISATEKSAKDEAAAVSAPALEQAQQEAVHQAAALGYDLSGVADALRYYRDGQHQAGDAALTTNDPTVRAAVEWTFSPRACCRGGH